MAYPGTGKMYRDNDKANTRREKRAPAKVGSSDDVGITEEAPCTTCGETLPKSDMFVTENGDVCPTHFTG